MLPRLVLTLTLTVFLSSLAVRPLRAQSAAPSEQDAVAPAHVAGIAKDPFDERAAERTESRADEVLREAIGGQ